MTSLVKEFLEKIKFQNCDWANKKLQLFNQDLLEKYYEFITKKSKHNTRINLSSIIGTRHCDYGGRETWLSMLSNAKRMNQALHEFKNNPRYYHLLQQGHVSDTLRYSTFDDNAYYITGDGNHRTAIAKFVFSNQTDAHLHRVNIEKYTIDYIFYDAYQELVKFCKKNKNFSAALNYDNKITTILVYIKNFGYIKLHSSEEIKSFLTKQCSPIGVLKNWFCCI